MIVAPELALAPVMLPVIAPTVQLKLLAVLAVNAMFGPIPLQVLALADVVTNGTGFTVTVMVYAEPTQVPTVEVGVIKYCTEPEVALLGLVKF